MNGRKKVKSILVITMLQAKVGLEKEFEVALRKLRGKDADVTREAAEIQAYVDTLQSIPKTQIFDLFGSKYIRSVIVSHFP